MKTILVIEDEPAIRQNIVETLMYEDYATLEAENGLEGVQVAQEQQPDLIICDVMMPRLDGYGVLRELQSDSSTDSIPFIFLTALSDKQSFRRGMDLGADDYLTKPFTPEELLNAVQSRLARHKLATSKYKTRPQIKMKSVLPQSPSAPLTNTVFSEIVIGETIRGYQIWEKLGEGGMGAVYKAYQFAIGREVAIKVLQQKYADNIEFIHRFQTEAELVARLEHPHIIPLYDYWHDANGVYIVMRYLRGGNLRSKLEQQMSGEVGPIARLLDQVADALSVAHSVGIIHRDLKPDNILLDERGNPYLTDFGLAKNLLSGTPDIAPEQKPDIVLDAQADFFKQQPNSTLFITDAEHLAGTPPYISPEQIRFEPLSPQTDIYSLGITIYEMLMGRQPFSGTLSEIISQHLYENLPSISTQRADVPKAVDDVLQRATAKEPRDRYSQANAFAADFRQAMRSK